MTGKLITTVRTDPTIKQIWNEALLNWEETKTEPTQKAVNLFLAHIGTEVGIDRDETLKSCYCFNIGNKRPGTNDDYCMYACGEELPLKLARDLCKASPAATIKYEYFKVSKDSSGKVLTVEPYASVHFEVPHSYTKFRAFPDLGTAIKKQLMFLASRPIWFSGLMTGDPSTYSRALVSIKGLPYYTASQERYSACMTGVLREIKIITSRFNWGDVQ